jgi:hypothetical protein
MQTVGNRRSWSHVRCRLWGQVSGPAQLLTQEQDSGRHSRNRRGVALSPCLPAWRTERQPGCTYLLMYSAFRSFPHVLHLKQPRCQCLSKATRAWPFFISKAQPPQPEEREQNTDVLTVGPGAGRAGDHGPSNTTKGTGGDLRVTLDLLLSDPMEHLEQTHRRGTEGQPPWQAGRTVLYSSLREHRQAPFHASFLQE